MVALVPAFLKMKWNVSELVTSIMFNYVVQFFAIYMVSYHFREVSSSSLASLEFEKTSKLPVVLDGTRIHAGVVLGIVLCVLVWFFLYRTSLGTKLRITGDNPLFAKYTGLKVTGLMVAAQVIAGAIAGMAAVRNCWACIIGLNGPQLPDTGGRVSWLPCWPGAIPCWFPWAAAFTDT